jgi:hypothetical protein
MRRICLGIIFSLIFSLVCASSAQTTPAVVVFNQPGFPVIDTAPLPDALLHQAFPNAQFVAAAELAKQLAGNGATLLILPYGSAFPEQQWSAIHNFLLRGGNLLTLGGRPFTRPVRAEDQQWKPLPETYAFARQLLISDYQQTPGSSTASPAVNRDEADQALAQLRWHRAYSVVVRFGQQETSPRVGASGTFDAELKTLLWGVDRQQRVAAPIIELDHFQNEYAGGRWIMVNCQIEDVFVHSAQAGAVLSVLAQQADLGAQLLRVTPSYALYLPHESWQLQLQWHRFQQKPAPSTLSVTISRDGRQEVARSVDLKTNDYPLDQTITVPTNGQPGFHIADIQLQCGAKLCGTYHTGFWVRDRAYLESGPQVTVDHDYFRIDGKPIEVVGTTYMASDAQRLYFRYPNPYVWDRDMQQIADAGLNMLRTGLWTDWDLVTGNSTELTERASRTIEAYLMTARSHGLPVQFTLFSFMPEVFGGTNAYLDPEALEREREFVTSVATPFAHVPYLIWDLINEPSFDNSKRLFNTKSNGDAVETSEWNKWLLHRYGNRDAIAEVWHTVLADGPIPAPSDADLTSQSANDGARPLSVYDFNLFAQESFASWARQMRSTIHATGSQQLITVGQDEGGALISPSPTFFGNQVDFSTMHSWWFNDDLLWDSLSVKQKNQPLLIQETGVMTETNADGLSRRNAEQDGALLEKKVGLAIGTGAGAIEWLWNINAVMRSQQEVTIGANRPDGTAKPEAQVLRAYAAFARGLQGHLSDPEPEFVSIVASQAEQYSVLAPMAVDAQHRAVRALEYQCHIAARMVAENHMEDIAGSKLVILPSVQMLQETTWQALLNYVKAGGNLLVTGPVDRDEHWQAKDRLKQLGIDATSTSLLYRSTEIHLDAETVEASFPIAAQRMLETAQLKNQQSYIEVRHGAGRVFVVNAPVELAESPQATVEVYRYVLSRVGIEPPFEASGLSPSMLVRRRVFKDSVLYLFASESSESQNLDIRDKLTGARMQLSVPALRTEMLLVDRATGKIISTYRQPEWSKATP